jgi:NADH:ubiquinone oxidoreductase subunit E
MTKSEAIPATDPLAHPERKAIIDKILRDNRHLPGGTMVILNELQNRIGYISLPMQDYVARQMHVPVSAVHGVVSFYSFFTTEPRGKHTVKFCLGTACYVGGSPKLISKATEILGIEPGQTTKDYAVTMELCRCVGACSQAPVVVVDEAVSGRVQVNALPPLLHKCLQESGEAA